ncbi:MAG: lipoyl(octanoyl) transferase [Phycisphaerales bacterium]|nr:lipoyl(octanoyl) transferase [Phycisphaerales bacterium]
MNAPSTNSPPPFTLTVRDLGRMSYAEAYALQTRTLEELLTAREQSTTSTTPTPTAGTLLLVEHDPVITVSRRATAITNLRADQETLQRLGVTVAETDRGGDITYHGPGQLVVYPILDLNLLSFRLHDYIRALEHAIIAAVASFDVAAFRDRSLIEGESPATGVWVDQLRIAPTPGAPLDAPPDPDHRRQWAKLAAIGVRVRHWISMHGLAINVDPDMHHFSLIVPCGLAGRPVTSLRGLLRDRCPTMPQVKAELTKQLTTMIQQRPQPQKNTAP